ncbi:MAG: MerR family transcriptional regulator, partial [Bacteroidota bacterium]
MAVYSIRDLEKLSGIKAHTLRVWEQRYGIIEPKRTKTNIRYYQDEDLKKLLNIALLNKNGIKISKIAKMTDKEIMQKVAAISEINFEFDTQLDALTISMIEMDEYKFDRIIKMNLQKMGFERTMLEIILPFLDKLSLLWLTGSINPVQENFISYLIRQKVIVAIDNEPFALGEDVKKFMLYLPEGESQELSLLFLQYLLKSRRNQVIYLGKDISVNDLRDAFQIHQPDYLYTIITETFVGDSVQKYITELMNTFESCDILISGYQVITNNIKSHNNVTVLKSLDQTIQFIDEIRNPYYNVN